MSDQYWKAYEQFHEKIVALATQVGAKGHVEVRRYQYDESQAHKLPFNAKHKMGLPNTVLVCRGFNAAGNRTQDKPLVFAGLHTIITATSLLSKLDHDRIPVGNYIMVKVCMVEPRQDVVIWEVWRKDPEATIRARLSRSIVPVVVIVQQHGANSLPIGEPAFYLINPAS